MTGDEILADRKNDKDFRWEKKVLAVKQAALDKGFSPNSAKLWVTAARSFFAYHRLPLQFRRSEKARLGEGRAQHEDYRFSLGDLQKMHDIGDLTEKYVLTAGKSFGLRAGDFLRLTRGDLEPYINREVPISIGEITTQKEDVKAFPFIDSDALPVIKLMLDRMTREGLTKPDSRVLNYERERQLTRILQRLVSKAGIVTGNKKVRFHCMRKFLIDHLASFMSESKWKQIVGKTLSEGAYVSPDSLREDYKRAMVETCFQKESSAEEMAVLAKKEALKIFAKAQGWSAEDIGKIFRRENVSSPEDELRILEELIAKGKKPGKDYDIACEDGEHCAEFSQIPEAHLLAHLKDGWEIVKELSNGEVIVKRVRNPPPVFSRVSKSHRTEVLTSAERARAFHRPNVKSLGRASIKVFKSPALQNPAIPLPALTFRIVGNHAMGTNECHHAYSCSWQRFSLFKSDTVATRAAP